MSITFETRIVYACEAPDCGVVDVVPVDLHDCVRWPADYDYEAKHTPFGWIRVHVRLRGRGDSYSQRGDSYSQRRWLVCSVSCLAEIVDRAAPAGIGQALQ